MTPKEAKADFQRLVSAHEAELFEWKLKYAALSDHDRGRLAFFLDVPGFPPKPIHPSYTHKAGTPHPHMVHEQAKLGLVWVKGYGWMDKTFRDDIIEWLLEESQS